MTMKPKTRKAPAKRAAPKIATKQALAESERDLPARLRVLEKAYQAAIAGTDEQDEIEMELSRSIPQDFDAVRDLLEFAIDMREGGFRSDGAKSLHNVTEVARNAGMEEMRRTINFVTENAHTGSSMGS
jgi:hypothetical protein